MPDLITRDIMGVSGGFNGRLSGTEHINPYDLGGDKTYDLSKSNDVNHDGEQ